VGRKKKKKLKAQYKPKQPKVPEPELSGKEAKIAKIRASMDKLEREYRQGKITKTIYEQMKAEHETKIRKLEQPSFFEKVSIYNVLLILILALSFYIRAILPQGSVFIGDIVRFGGNDPWYHMRLVENTIHNFPHRIMFDPYTHFPYGNSLHFGPLFDQTIAFLALLVGFGSPSQHTIEAVGAYFPAVLGTLVVIPVYVIGREIFDRRVGILSALLVAIMPGQFLSRSLLGFTDHHVAETLLSTLTIMFFLLAVKKANEQELTFEHVLKKDWNALKTPIIFSALAGLMLGCYLLCWVGALLFAFVIAVYVVIQCVVDHMRGKSPEYLCVAGIITFVISLIMVTPLVVQGWGMYSQLHIFSLVAGILAFLILGAISKTMNQRNINRSYYPLGLIGVGIIGIVIVRIINPSLFNSMVGSFHIFHPTGGALTIAEVSSIFYRGGQFSLEQVWYNFPGITPIIPFTSTFFIAIFSMMLVVRHIIKEWRPEDVLLVVWSVIMLFATIGQNRFAYYFVVNVAILSGYFGIKALELGGLGKLYEHFKRRVADTGDVGWFASRYVKWHHVFVVVFVALLLIYPNVNITMGSGPGAARWTGGPNMDWYSALDWMRYNTPDPGLDYYALYEEPASGEAYQYPDSAYGVMSWWDYGHWITRIAHRIPNANPFQAGIGGPGPNGTIRPGACMFFTATNESTANWILDELGSKYVITDIEMATGKFWAMGTFAEGGDVNKYWAKYQVTSPDGSVGWSPEYYKTMVVRLHFFNGENFTSPYGDQIEPLEHYRLVYESPTTVGTIEGREIKYVKIFEYVP